MELFVHRGAAALDVGDVEEVLVGAAGELGVDRGADRRPGAVAAGEVRGVAARDRAVRSAERRRDPLVAVAADLEGDELGAPLDPNAERREALREEQLVLVLRKDDPERIRAETAPEVTELEPSCALGPAPEVDGGEDETAAHDLRREIDTAVELEGARLHRERARRRPRRARLVDDANADPELRERDREHEPGGAGARDQDVDGVRVHHRRFPATRESRKRQCPSGRHPRAAPCAPELRPRASAGVW